MSEKGRTEMLSEVNLDWSLTFSEHGWNPSPFPSFPIWRILKPRFLSENPETQFAECPGSPHFWVTHLYLNRWIKAIQRFSSVAVSLLHGVRFDLGLVLVLKSSQPLRAPFYPDETGSKERTLVAVAQCRELVNLCRASVSLPSLFSVPFPRYAFNASFQSMPFDELAILAFCPVNFVPALHPLRSVSSSAKW